MLLVDTRRDVARLERFHAAAADRLALDDALLWEPAPEVSGWSAVQQLFHVLLANELAYRNVRLVLEGTSPWVRRGEGPNLLGYLILSAGSIPRGKAKAPRLVVPPKKPVRAVVEDTLRGNVDALAALAARLDDVLAAGPRGSNAGVPHQDLGNLGPPLWLAFAALHGEHHLAIADEVLAARRVASARRP